MNLLKSSSPPIISTKGRRKIWVLGVLENKCLFFSKNRWYS